MHAGAIHANGNSLSNLRVKDTTDSTVIPLGRKSTTVFDVLKFGELNNMNFSNNMPIEIFQFFCWNP